jgi:trimeric autotransporter adhesin
LTNFPALVMLGTNIANFSYSQFVLTNGYDLRFSDSAETTNLSYEIERWDVNGQSYVWVQVPLIQNNTDYIWAYWGNPSLAIQQAFTTNGSTWTTNYMAVWHLNQTNLDSTIYKNNGTSFGNTNVTGRVGGAQGFNGSSAYIGLQNNASLRTNVFTIEAWINLNAQHEWQYAFSAGDSGPDQSRIDFGEVEYPAGTKRFGGGVWPSPGIEGPTDCSMWAGQWHHVVYVLDVVHNKSYVYENGVQTAMSTGTATGSSDRFAIGSKYKGGDYLDGLLDEMRISNTPRSSNWVWACWLNQASNTIFSTYGSVTNGGISSNTTPHGVPYSWLSIYGITTNQSQAETNDPDGDGMATWQEYFAGTDPGIKSSAFAVLSVATNNTLNWFGTTNSGVTNGFRMYRGTNLLRDTWSLVASNLTRSATGTNTWTDPSPPLSPLIFYRPAAPAS